MPDAATLPPRAPASPKSSAPLVHAPVSVSRPPFARPAADSAATPRTRATAWSEALFGHLYGRNLIYNICWEDPALDHEMLALQPQHRVLVITSAGCNALDYALAGPREVLAVDANPRQNALLALKIAGVRTLEFADFFALFGRGWHAQFATLYATKLRPALPEEARAFWDRRAHWFSRRRPLYHRGLTGIFGRIMRRAIRLRPSLWREITALYATRTLEEQRAHYETRVRPRLWSPAVRWALSRPIMLALIGVPEAQRHLIVSQHPGGVAGFVEESLDRLFTTVPARTNYFWYLYTFGDFSPECCPRYLTPEGFAQLKDGLVDRISIHTCTVTRLLEEQREPVDRFVLLDHLDWLDGRDAAALEAEWTQIRRNARPGARVLLRSAHTRPPFFDTVRVGPERLALADWLRFDEELPARLHLRDRVHTYASCHLAEVV